MIVAQDNRPPKAAPGQRYLESAASLEELLQHMSAQDQEDWKKFGHLRVEPAFQDRVFVVYTPCGRDEQGKQRAPKIIATVRVVSFVAKDDTGCIIRLLNEQTGKEMEVTHTPKKLFDCDAFVAIPPMFQIRWDLRQHGGKWLRSLSYLLFIKTRNDSKYFSTKNTYVETPNKLKDLYSHLDLKLDL